MHQPENPVPPAPGAEFVALFLAEQRRIYCYIVTLTCNPEDAEDLLQETATLLFTKFEEFRPGSNFYAWACKTARFLVLNHRRKQARQEIVLDEDVLELLAEIPEDEPGLAPTRHSALYSCLDKLESTDRSLFERRYAGSVAVKTLASELGRPADSVCRSLGRIRRALLACIRRRLRSGGKKGEDA